MRMLKLLGNGYSYEDTLLWKKDMKTPPAPAPISPTVPVEEAVVKQDDTNSDKKKKSTGKQSLKVPLSTSNSAGLKV